MSEPTASAFLTPAATESSLGSLEQHCRMLEGEVLTLRENESRLKQQYQESQRREKVLVRRLAAKEQEMQDIMNQINELKVNQTPGVSSLRSALLDPAVNLILQKLKNELLATKARLEEMQNELSAWKFTPDSNTGKRLMAKCRLLYQENEELGRMTSNGRLAKLEGELALQRGFSDEVKKSQSELDEFMQDVDEDVEGMQSTIYLLQQELVRAKQCVENLERENEKLKESQDSQSGSMMNGDVSKMEMNDHISTCKDVLIKDKRDSSDSEPELIIKVSEQDLMKSDLEDDTIKDNCDVRTNSDDVLSPKDTNGVDTLTERTSKANVSLDYNKKRNYDSDSSDCSNGHRTNSTSVKKARRSSVLSLDYNDMEDDALVISTNGETNVSDVE